MTRSGTETAYGLMVVYCGPMRVQVSGSQDSSDNVDLIAVVRYVGAVPAYAPPTRCPVLT
eukprot:868793-Rhodomonas_salina.2